MTSQDLDVPLTQEERYAMVHIVSKGNVVHIDDRNYLMVEVSPMLMDFLRAIKAHAATNEQSDESYWSLGDREEPTIPSNRGMSLSEAFAAFVEERRENWGETSHQAYDRVYRIMSETLGPDTPMKSITPDHLVQVKDVIMALPKIYGVLFKGLSIQEIIERQKAENLPLRSLTTINHELKYVATFFEWATSRWVIDRHPAKQFMLPPQRMSNSITKRDPFSIKDLQCIFSAPIYSGCLNDGYGFARPGLNKPQRARFWIPLIALFSGMRMGEIVRLRKVDIKVVDDTHCFVVSSQVRAEDSGNRLKNQAATRKVPIHSTLLALGFLKFVDSKSDLLFDEIKGRDHRFRVNLFSQWFNGRFLKSVGITSNKLAFHSFRHCFRDELRNAGIPVDIVREIGGWSRTRYGFESIYGSGVRTAVLAEAVEKVHYPGLDISHLFRDQEPAEESAQRKNY